MLQIPPSPFLESSGNAYFIGISADFLPAIKAQILLTITDNMKFTMFFLLKESQERRIVIACFQDEEKNDTIPGLKNKITKIFANNALLPDRDSNYRKPKDLTIPIPFSIADQRDAALWHESFKKVPFFVSFSSEKDRNFNEYFTWLHDDLHLKTFSLPYSKLFEMYEQLYLPSLLHSFQYNLSAYPYNYSVF